MGGYYSLAAPACQVACLSDSEAHLALDKDDPFAVQTKPHGHGDVHSLLYSSGLLKRWVQAGVKWVAFFQDTNALVFRGLPAALGERLSVLPYSASVLCCCTIRTSSQSSSCDTGHWLTRTIRTSSQSSSCDTGHWLTRTKSCAEI